MWIGHNRKNIHINARKGSGGVEFLINNRLLKLYNIDHVDKSVGVIKLLLRHKYNDCSIVLFGCYIPPVHSTRGRMSHEVFSYLSTHIYQDVTDMDCTVQITFIFIDFRVCDFAFAFKTQNAPCISRLKRVLFSDRFQFAF